jgi:hypothetical protein
LRRSHQVHARVRRPAPRIWERPAQARRKRETRRRAARRIARGATRPLRAAEGAARAREPVRPRLPSRAHAACTMERSRS